MKKPNLIIVDDHQIFRQGLKTLIDIENIATVIGEANNGKEFIELLKKRKPDIVLMDIDMPGMNGFEATKYALNLYPDLKIIAFTMFGEYDYYVKMIDIGAKGFILKSSDISEFEKAINYVMKGERYFAINIKDETNYSFQRKTPKVRTDILADSNKRKGIVESFVPWF